MSTTELSLAGIDTFTARGNLYRLLARLWQHELEGTFCEQLREAPLADAYVACGGTPPPDDAAVVEDLALDYCQLFVGPANHLPPVQSVWQGGQFHGKTVDSMRQFAEIMGYDATALPRRLMLDHLGVQFDAMGHLLGQMGLGSTLSDEEFDSACQLAEAFYRTHLAWPARLFELALPRATTDFYRAAIALTRDFLASEADAWTS